MPHVGQAFNQRWLIIAGLQGATELVTWKAQILILYPALLVASRHTVQPVVPVMAPWAKVSRTPSPAEAGSND
jgi:hypothetical protein